MSNIPQKFAGAISFRPTLVDPKGKEFQIWVGVPIVEPHCPRCTRPVNAGQNAFVLKNANAGQNMMIGAIRCSQCRTEFNEARCYFHDNFALAPFTFLALCVLSDENPLEVIQKRGFVPARMAQEGVIIADGATVGRNVSFLPPVLINRDSIVTDGCRIGPFVYLEKARLEKRVNVEYSDIRRSTLNRDASYVVAHDSYVG